MDGLGETLLTFFLMFSLLLAIFSGPIINWYMRKRNEQTRRK